MNDRGPWFLASLALVACRATSVEEAERDTPVTVRCEGPKLQAVDETVALRGRIQPPAGGDLSVASQVPGRLARIAVREGQVVRQGDVIATIEDANARDALRQSDAALAQAQALAVNANATLERTRQLVGRGIAAGQELDDATARSRETTANVAAAEASADLARRTLGRIMIRSSFAGIVTRVWRGAGALVDGTALTPVVQLSATSTAEFVAEATAAELVQVKEGDAVHVTLVDGMAFDGTVSTRGRALDSSTGLGAVRIVLPSLGEGVPIGAYGRAVVILAHRERVRTLPATALRGAVSDGAQVAVCKEGRAEIRRVRVGWRDDGRFEVGDTVGEDDRVAVDHVLGLEDGMAIAEAP